MERNQFSSGDSTLGQPAGSTAGSGSSQSGFGSSQGESTAQAYSQTENADATASSSANTGDHGLADRARGICRHRAGKLADVGSTVRERAGTMKNSLADALTSGADRLRQRGTSSGSTAQNAGATDAGSVAVESDGRIAQVTKKVAAGMERRPIGFAMPISTGLRTGIEAR